MAEIDLSKYIKSIRIESAFLPDIFIPDPFKPGPPNPFLQALKPKITVDTSIAGVQVVTPYGDPGPSMWPQIKTALLIAGFLFLVRRALK
jgi:hypothetical protein